jgi:shikimate kinase/3-dehydroquinate synthase
MGSGKSSVGRELGRRWGVEFHDTDDGIVAAAGMSIAEVFAAKGEPWFRRLEEQVVAQALREQDGVLALGGGATVSPATQGELAAYRESGGVICWLEVSVDPAMQRVASDGSRPMIAGDARGRWIELDAARRPVLEAVATLRVSTDTKSAAEVADEIERSV